MADAKSVPEWEKKNVWRKTGKRFMVEVYHYLDEKKHLPPDERELALYHEGPNRWNVYAYIYPDHPHFARFDRKDGMWQEAATQLPFHGGPSYLAFPQYEDKVTAVKVGCDYHHLHDDRYTFVAPDDAVEIFADADALFAQLQEMAQ